MKLPSPTSLLSPEHIAMIDKGVSAIVSTCDAHLRPSIMRAMGSSITPDGGSVTVFLSRRQSCQLLLDLAATGRVAVVFSEPLSHQTVQVKASQMRLEQKYDLAQKTAVSDGLLLACSGSSLAHGAL